MAKHPDDLSPDTDAFIGIGRRWRWLFDYLVGRPAKGRFVVQSVSLRRGVGLQSVVVKALDCETAGNVIIFGQAPTFYLALTNATNSILKEAWKPDKYNRGLLS